MTGEFVVPFARRGSIVGFEELRSVQRLLGTAETLSDGSLRSQFEQRFADLVGSRHTLSVTSGTVALELAIELLDLSPGDEVIATPQTFQATLQPLLGYNVRVRFCDIDPVTLNVDTDVLESLVTDRTRAILLVHYGGYPADMDRIMALARRHDVIVVEDCAHALGAEHHSDRPGALGDIGCFSFHSTKNITTLGEGGMITVKREEWADRVDRRRSNQVDGLYVPDTRDEPVLLPWMKFSAEVYQQACVGVRRAGTNATLSEAAAAVGIAQLARLDTFVDRRRWIAGRLDEVLGRFEQVRLQTAEPGRTHAYHLYTFFLTAGREAREEFVHLLHRRGVEVQLRYFPQHLTPEWRWRGHREGECPTAERLWFTEHVNLPCHPGLSDDQVDYLVDTIADSMSEIEGGRQCRTSTSESSKAA